MTGQCQRRRSAKEPRVDSWICPLEPLHIGTRHSFRQGWVSKIERPVELMLGIDVLPRIDTER